MGFCESNELIKRFAFSKDDFWKSLSEVSVGIDSDIFKGLKRPCFELTFGFFRRKCLGMKRVKDLLESVHKGH